MAPVDDSPRQRRREPAWTWYGLAALIVAVLAILDATGAISGLGP